MSGELDHRVRLAAFQWLRAQMDVHGEVLPRSVLAQGFDVDGRRVPLLGPQGIFKPALCEVPLSITTIPGQVPGRDGRRDAGVRLPRDRPCAPRQPRPRWISIG